MSKIYVVDSGTSGNLWWRVYSDGWLEQGGIAEMPVYEGHIDVISFAKPFRDTSYTITRATCSTNNVLNVNRTTYNGDDIATTIIWDSRTRTSIEAFIWDGGSNDDHRKKHQFYWSAQGWGA